MSPAIAKAPVSNLMNLAYDAGALFISLATCEKPGVCLVMCFGGV